MRIKFKGIYHERTEDAPFIGALLCADKCTFNCRNCINDDIKKAKSIEMEDVDIVNEVLSNPFNQGIILGGLEWTLQPEEMFRLIELAKENKLEVILYTGRDKDKLLELFPKLLDYDIYIKYGRYVEELHIANYKKYGVYLASSNQDLIKIRQGVLYDNENKSEVPK